MSRLLESYFGVVYVNLRLNIVREQEPGVCVDRIAQW